MNKNVRCSDGKSKIKSRSFKSAASAKKKTKVASSSARIARPATSSSPSNSSSLSSSELKEQGNNESAELIEVHPETDLSDNNPKPKQSVADALSSLYKRNAIHVDKSTVEDEEETLNLNELVEFIPYYDVYKDREKAESKLNDVVKFLNDYPKYSATVVGNASWHQRQDFQVDDIGQEIPLVFGKSREVYSQVLRVYLSPEYNDLLVESGRDHYKEIRVGRLINSRALAIKKSLVDKGIDANRIGVLLGEFTWAPR